ncbi:MAG: hypothetical protein ACXWOV_18860 [Isosphaeraceae bacterium]
MGAVTVALAADVRGFGSFWRSWRAVVTTFSIFFGVSLILIGVLAGTAGPTASS